MEKHIDYNFFISRNQMGEKMKTDVYLFANGIFKAYSCYAKDKDEMIVGYGESTCEEDAVELSKRDLLIEWREAYPN